MLFLKVSPRHLTLYALLAGCTVILLVQLFFQDRLSNPYSHIFSHCEKKPACDLQCSLDPFKRPGMLYLGSEASDSRWIPFPLADNDNGTPRSVELVNSEPLVQAFESACPQYMRQLSQNETTGMEWIQNKTVLFIGSSHDRNNIRNFCQETHGEYSSIGDHTAGFCRLEQHDLVLAFWFTYGAIDADDYEWFSPSETRPLTFENRIKDVMIPWMIEEGLPSPNLVVETSLFWDDGFLKQFAVHSNRQGHEAFTYSELAWHRSRIRSLVFYTQSLFGNDIPIMLRTRHLRDSNKYNKILRIFQLDQNLRHVARELQVKLFTWGDLLEGYTDFYDSDQHFKHGPVTWLFGDMTLFYLKQATAAGNCWSCDRSRPLD